MNSCLLLCYVVNIIFNIISYFELPIYLKTNLLSFYLLFLIFNDTLGLSIKYFKIDKPNIIVTNYICNVLIFISYPYILYMFPVLIDYKYCGIYEGYLACSSFHLVAYSAILIYSTIMWFSILIISTSVKKTYNSIRMRYIALDIIKNLPTSIIPPDSKICSICLEDAKDEDEWKILTCNHKFHSSCIDEWLLNHLNCPICRKEQKLLRLQELEIV